MIEFLEEYKRKIEILRNLNANEANTKSNLIEPLLNHFGWDIHNIEDVEKERTVLSGNFVDYALKISGDPKLYVEAKKIQDNLTNLKDISKAISYANDDGIPWCIITNGNLIHLYNPQEPGDLTNKKVLEINIFEEINLEFLKYFYKERVKKDELSSDLKKILITNKVIQSLTNIFDEIPLQLITLLQKKLPELLPEQIKDSFENISASFENITTTSSPSPDVEISSKEKSIQIQLPAPRKEGDIPSWRKYHLLDIPKKIRRFFPGYKIPFIIKTDIGDLETWVTGDYAGATEGDPDAGLYMSKSFTKFYRNHPELKIGDIIIITKIGEKEYKLDFKTN